ncbi:hypothetical protein MMC16_005925 [Acarospora aff. strigata]|nr:hypothetical protein [Acarospora aff. strigata]
MRSTFVSLSCLALFASSTFAAPTEFAAPPGGFENVNYPPGTGANLPSYPPGTGANLPSYPPGTGAGACPGQGVFRFTSQFSIVAVGAQVVNGTTPRPGPADAVGYFNYGLNSAENTICFNITLINVAGVFQSPAITATHIHQGPRGGSGPVRIAFPNPVGDDKLRRSVGCLVGPFTTGIMTNGADNGAGFRVAQIEANPAGFFTDAHTNLFPVGVVRGQFA